jgi:hypothetical protein
MHWLNDLIAWWESLSPAAVFFFSIPFAVAAAALLRDGFERARHAPRYRMQHRVPRRP